MNIKDAIFDLLRDTYGLHIDAIAERLALPADAVQKAVAEMLAADRLWETAEGKYRCVLPPPPWLEAVRDALVCEGWPGMSWFYTAEDSCLEVYPAPFIREGEEEDGICFMVDWHVTLDDLLGLFDEKRAIVFGSASQEGTGFSIEGTIDGADAWIRILDRPPEGTPPELLMTEDGGFRELTEEELEEYEELPEEGAEDDEEPPPLRGLWTPSDN